MAKCRTGASKQQLYVETDKQLDLYIDNHRSTQLVPEAIPQTNFSKPKREFHAYHSKEHLLLHPTAVAHFNKQLLKWNLMIQSKQYSWLNRFRDKKCLTPCNPKMYAFQHKINQRKPP